VGGLSGTSMNASAIRMLTESWPFPTLTNAYLGWNHFGDEGLRLLAECHGVGRHRTLHLEGARPGTEALLHFVNSPHVAGLQEVFLTNSSLGDSGAEMIADSPLREGPKLVLFDNGLSDRGKQILKARFGDRVIM
jgi:hypothetical protein